MEARWKRQTAADGKSATPRQGSRAAPAAHSSRRQHLLAPCKQEVTGSNPVPPIAVKPLPKRYQLQRRSVLRAVDRSCGSVVEALGFRTSLVDALGGCETTVGPTPTTRLTVADALQNAKDLPEEVSRSDRAALSRDNLGEPLLLAQSGTHPRTAPAQLHVPKLPQGADGVRQIGVV